MFYHFRNGRTISRESLYNNFKRCFFYCFLKNQGNIHQTPEIMMPPGAYFTPKFTHDIGLKKNLMVRTKPAEKLRKTEKKTVLLWGLFLRGFWLSKDEYYKRVYYGSRPIEIDSKKRFRRNSLQDGLFWRQNLKKSK